MRHSRNTAKLLIAVLFVSALVFSFGPSSAATQYACTSMKHAEAKGLKSDELSVAGTCQMVYRGYGAVRVDLLVASHKLYCNGILFGFCASYAVKPGEIDLASVTLHHDGVALANCSFISKRSPRACTQTRNVDLAKGAVLTCTFFAFSDYQKYLDANIICSSALKARG